MRRNTVRHRNRRFYEYGNTREASRSRFGRVRRAPRPALPEPVHRRDRSSGTSQFRESSAAGWSSSDSKCRSKEPRLPATLGRGSGYKQPEAFALEKEVESGSDSKS